MALMKAFLAKLQQALHIWPALQMVWSSAPGWSSARIALLLVQGILPLLSLYLTKLIIDTLSLGLTTDPAIVGQKLIVLLLLVGGVTLVSDFCVFLEDLVNTGQSHQVTDAMSDRLHAKSIEMDLEYYETPQYLDTLKRAQEEALYRPNQVLTNLIAVGQQSISLITMVVLLLSLHWGIAGILFVAAVPSVLVKVKYSNRMYDWLRQQTAIDRKTEYLSWMLTADLFAKEIRLFNLGTLFSDRFRQLRQLLRQGIVSLSTQRAIAGLVAQLLSSILVISVYGFIITQSFQGILKIGDLFLYYQAFERGQTALKGALESLSGLYEDNLFLANLFEFLNLEAKVVEPENPLPFPRPIQKGIRFDQVSFQYSASSRQALYDIDLTIKPGEVVALVGENGSGKTTLIKLLCRLYDPSSGRITIDGIDLKEMGTLDLRRQISVVFQDYAKYNLTALENIWLGNTDLPEVTSSIISAARQSGADKVIAKLPQGYDTILGKLFENGEELSIGQWQKIALARAFLRNSQLIVLDEPTSAMDTKTEYEVFQKFRELIKEQSAVLISHRLSTVKMADHIYVLQNGRIIEHGTHEKLIRDAGVYANLFETQAQTYR